MRASGIDSTQLNGRPIQEFGEFLRNELRGPSGLDGIILEKPFAIVNLTYYLWNLRAIPAEVRNCAEMEKAFRKTRIHIERTLRDWPRDPYFGGLMMDKRTFEALQNQLAQIENQDLVPRGPYKKFSGRNFRSSKETEHSIVIMTIIQRYGADIKRKDGKVTNHRALSLLTEHLGPMVGLFSEDKGPLQRILKNIRAGRCRLDTP